MKRASIVSILLLLSLCGAVFAEDDPVIAWVGDKKITLSDYKRITSYYDAEKQKNLEQNPQSRVAIVMRLVQGMVLGDIARQKGFDKREDVKEQIALTTNDLLASDYLKKEVIEKITVTEEDMQLYYKTHSYEFKRPDRIKVSQILVKVDKSGSEEERKKAEERAEELLKRIRSGEDFAKLASEFSDDPGTRQTGGDMGFIRRGTMEPEFEKAAFSLKQGEVSGVVETSYGLHIIKVEERKEGVVEPYDKVRDRIKEKVFNDLKKARVEEVVHRAMDDAKVKINIEPLKVK